MTVNDEAKTTRIDFDRPALSPPKYDRPFSLKKGSIHDFLTKEELSEGVIQRTVDKTRWSEDRFVSARRNAELVGRSARRQCHQADGTPYTRGKHWCLRSPPACRHLRHNAPRWDSLPTDLRFEKRIEKYKLVNGIVTFDKYELVPPAFGTNWDESHSGAR